MNVSVCITHGKCFVRYLRTSCWRIRNLTRSLRSLVRFLIQKRVCKYRTPALSMKYSLFLVLSALENKIRIPAQPCNILYLYNNIGVAICSHTVVTKQSYYFLLRVHPWGHWNQNIKSLLYYPTMSNNQAPVVRKVDSASAIGFANAYSLDSDLSSG